MAALFKWTLRSSSIARIKRKPAGRRVQGLLNSPDARRSRALGAESGGSGEIQLHPGHHHAAGSQRTVEALLELLAQCTPIVRVRLGLAVQRFQRAAADQLVGLLDHR